MPAAETCNKLAHTSGLAEQLCMAVALLGKSSFTRNIVKQNSETCVMIISIMTDGS